MSPTSATSSSATRGTTVRGPATELNNLLVAAGVSVWFIEKDIVLGQPFLRKIDRGLAKSRTGLVGRDDFEALVNATTLTRDQLRNLWLHQAVAGKLVMRPDSVIAHARRNLAHLRKQHPHGRVTEQFDTWNALLNGPLHELLRLLGSAAEGAVQLRQNSPFAGVLTERERMQVLRNFNAETKRSAWIAAGDRPTHPFAA